MKFFSFSSSLSAVLLAFSVAVSGPVGAETSANFEELFEERVRSIVAVEFFVEDENDRSSSAELGVVVAGDGLVVLPEDAIPSWLPVDQLREFKVLPLRSRTKYDAEYLGQDPLNGWHFLRVASEELHERVLPITAYDVDEPRMGDVLWGIAVMDEDFDYEPYFLFSRVSLVRDLPQDRGFTTSGVASPGSLVFSGNGSFVGWAGNDYLTEAVLHVGNEHMPVGFQRTRESGMFLPADEFLPYLDRVPSSPHEQVSSWIGVTGLEPVESEVAEFLDIADSGGIILSDVVKGGPAAEAGLLKGDVAIAIDGEPIPYYRPHRAVTQHLQREILRREPGDSIRLTVIRGTEKLEQEVRIGEQPKTLRDARREYFPGLGLTVREFLVFDGIAQRVEPEAGQGLIVHYIRPNGAAHTAGLQMGDWVREVDGEPVSSYSDAVELIAEAEEEERRETVFLISRQNETSVVRVRRR